MRFGSLTRPFRMSSLGLPTADSANARNSFNILVFVAIIRRIGDLKATGRWQYTQFVGKQANGVSVSAGIERIGGSRFWPTCLPATVELAPVCKLAVLADAMVFDMIAVPQTKCEKSIEATKTQTPLT